MTVSISQRRNEMAQILTRFAERLRDNYHFAEMIGPQDEGFTEFNTTSWRELQDEGYLKPQHTFGSAQYSLTAGGWLKALKLSGELESPNVRSRGIALARALKTLVKGRDVHFDQIADERELAPQTGLPGGWIYNALSCNLLNDLFPNDNMTVRYDYRGKCFRVPPTFGMDWREPL